MFHSLKEIRAHCPLTPVPLQALYTPIRRLLTWVVVLAISLAVHPRNQYSGATACMCGERLRLGGGVPVELVCFGTSPFVGLGGRGFFGHFGEQGGTAR